MRSSSGSETRTEVCVGKFKIRQQRCRIDNDLGVVDQQKLLEKQSVGSRTNIQRRADIFKVAIGFKERLCLLIKVMRYSLFSIFVFYGYSRSKKVEFSVK